MKNYYITTTLPYVNSEPHIGFASEIVRADILARFHRDVLKEKVFFNTGTDEHGQKIYDKAQEQKITPQEFCDKQVEKFKALKENLNLSFDNFVRTTDEDHIKSAQEFWRRCYEKGDIYKAKYKVKYCVGCELEKTDSELNEKGRCPLHPNKDLQVSEEENYFFKFSNYQKPLLDFYQKNPDFVQPEKRFNEIKNFVKENLKDFSISRLKSKMSWGVPVPDDEKQVMYVWFDALVNYISVLNWPEDENNFKKWWPGVQIAGKDNLRQQSAMWQAMLMSAGLSNSEKIYINGFIISDGQKMSKSLGNVISPAEMVEKFGVDGTRYLLIASAIFGEDVDLTWERMFEKYNSDLANGLGNVFSRVIKLSQKIDLKNSEILDFMQKEVKIDLKRYSKDFESGHLERLLSDAQQKISELDKKIETVKPWEISKTDPEKFQAEMLKFLTELKEIQEMIVIFLPETAEKMKRMLETREMESLFPRIQEN
jgi:methionyl-tRNA synthetase